MKDYTEKDNLYCYKGTIVLKNKLNITDFERLAQAEDEITAVNLAELQQRVFDDELDYDFFLWVHKFVFSDVYEWAGTIRKVDISKEDFKFAHFLYIENELRKLFKQLEEEGYLKIFSKTDLVNKITFYMTELNVLHPFREGNGRIIREYFRILLESCGYYLNFTKNNKPSYFKAMINSPYNTEHLLKFIQNNLLTL